MKKKRQAHSKDQPSIKKKQQHHSDSGVVHEFIEAISDKVDSFKENMDLSALSSLDCLFEHFTMDESMERGSGNEESQKFNYHEEQRDFHYADEEPECHYRYQFTNSELLAFIASLDPIEYVIVITLLGILISLHLNLVETEILFTFLNNLSHVVEMIAEQEAFQEKLILEEEEHDKNQALQDDFTYLNEEITELRETIKRLEAKLKVP